MGEKLVAFAGASIYDLPRGGVPSENLEDPLLETSERRDHQRDPLQTVVGIDSSDRAERVGVTRDLSAKGALFHSASRYRPGEQVSLRFRDPISEQELEGVGARVVRTDIEPIEKGSFFCHLIAVEFEEPLPR